MWKDDQTAAIWARLRATRADPPRPATASDARRKTYISALEQAEQLFQAAATVGPPTKPLLVFYGLSQAGRAIAAAADTADGDWQLTGHGIRCTGLDGPLADIGIIGGEGKGSFGRLSEMLHSPTWDRSSPVDLASLWDAMPETRLWPIGDGDQHPHVALYVDYRASWPEPHPLAPVSLCYLPPWLAQSPTLGRDLTEYLRGYPSLGPHSYVKANTGPEADPQVTIYDDGWGEVTLNLMVANGRPASEAERRSYFERIATRHGSNYNDFYLVPAVGRNARPMHPLMTWWSVLFSLSMLARYQPAEWYRHIDVDSSPHAVPIEQLLTRSTTVVPELIALAIRDVSRMQTPAFRC